MLLALVAIDSTLHRAALLPLILLAWYVLDHDYASVVRLQTIDAYIERLQRQKRVLARSTEIGCERHK